MSFIGEIFERSLATNHEDATKGDEVVQEIIATPFLLHELTRKERDNNGGVLEEMWMEIFQNLEPVFLNAVLRTSKLFNAAASSDTLMNRHLDIYFPTKKIANRTLSPFNLFLNFYSQERSNLSPMANRLLDFIITLDFSHIQSSQFDPDVLFEEDDRNISVLSHLNNKSNQYLCDIVFQRITAWFEMTANNRNFFLAMSFSSDPFSYQTNRGYKLIDFAVALNQITLIKNSSKHLLDYSVLSTKPRIKLFELACFSGHLEMLKVLLSMSNFAYINISDILTHAIKGHKLEIVEFIFLNYKHHISTGASRDAISLAVNNDDEHLAILEFLLSQINDVSAFRYGPDRLNLLELSCQRGHIKAVKLIDKFLPALMHARTDQYFLNAAKTGCIELMDFLLSYQANLSDLFSNNPELLLTTIEAKQIPLLQHLLELGANPNAAGDDGELPLQYAVFFDQFEAVQLLEKSGANLSAQNIDGNTALDVAHSKQNALIIDFLMNAQMNQYKKRKADVALTEDKEESAAKRPRR